jgi:hypothetical protein
MTRPRHHRSSTGEVGYGRTCHRGHVVEGDNAYLTTAGYWDCRECRAIRNEALVTRATDRDYWPNPWRGLVACPGCGSSEWTLPRHGRADPGPWRCVWPCGRFFPVGFDAEFELVALEEVLLR